jgi:hypothetical protein
MPQTGVEADGNKRVSICVVKSVGTNSPEFVCLLFVCWLILLFHFVFLNLFRINAFLEVLRKLMSLLLIYYSITNISNAVCLAPPEDEQVMLETCRSPLILNKLNESASRWFHYTDILWCTVNKALSLLHIVVCFTSSDKYGYCSAAPTVTNIWLVTRIIYLVSNHTPFAEY